MQIGHELAQINQIPNAAPIDLLRRKNAQRGRDLGEVLFAPARRNHNLFQHFLRIRQCAVRILGARIARPACCQRSHGAQTASRLSPNAQHADK